VRPGREAAPLSRLVAVVALSLAVALRAALPVAEGQASASTVRVGYLGLTSASPEVLRVVNAFKDGLRQLGYVDGQNLALEYRWAYGQSDRLPELAAELVRLKVNVIVAPNTPAVIAAKRATTTIPIVFIGAEPVSIGLGSNLARPGGNVTGVSLLAGPEIGGKYLELLREAVPRVSRVVLLRNPDHPGHPPVVREVESAARSSGLTLHVVNARTPDELDAAFAAMVRARAEALVVLADANFFRYRKRLAELAERSRLPAIYGMTEHVEAGGLLAYAANFEDAARRAATHVERILKGARPGDLPIEQPTRFELIINSRSARALGLTIPTSLLSRADRVIE
jgi:putative ABC transport system substrate-binding protein